MPFARIGRHRAQKKTPEEKNHSKGNAVERRRSLAEKNRCSPQILGEKKKPMASAPSTSSTVTFILERRKRGAAKIYRNTMFCQIQDGYVITKKKGVTPRKRLPHINICRKPWHSLVQTKRGVIYCKIHAEQRETPGNTQREGRTRRLQEHCASLPLGGTPPDARRQKGIALGRKEGQDHQVIQRGGKRLLVCKGIRLPEGQGKDGGKAERSNEEVVKRAPEPLRRQKCLTVLAKGPWRRESTRKKKFIQPKGEHEDAEDNATGREQG